MECVRVNLLQGGGWNLMSNFSDTHPKMDKDTFTRKFAQKYRCKVFYNSALHTYYIEWTPKNWTWFCLRYSIDQFIFV